MYAGGVVSDEKYEQCTDLAPWLCVTSVTGLLLYDAARACISVSLCRSYGFLLTSAAALSVVLLLAAVVCSTVLFASTSCDRVLSPIDWL